ncbi:sulfatase-like hydrolase/transferase [Rhodanobacter sp. C03]|uniref:sulfatase-like hydrolase/transferase n=1 Tax=Rhodanobacter sp. C03 TaxID=1945858 RepID=UPI0020C1BC84|nr:sulfatase-like hydrolase/transferase [Rhodanobacter sp. C03]
MLADFTYFARTSLVETLEHYPHFRRLALALCVFVPLLVGLIWYLSRNIFTRLRLLPAAGIRLAGAAICALLFGSCLLPSGPFASLYHDGLWDKLKGNAQLTDFFINIHDSRPHLPPLASAVLAEQNWALTATGMPATHTPYPDIVQVLEESTFDPAHFTGCTIAQCRVRMFQPDADTRAHGMLRTHTFGGGTWVSEFTALTGMPQDIFGQAGMYAPYVLAPRIHDSLPMLLHRLGYLTVAIYPAGGNFINARNAYREYGFDQFYDINDLGLTMWHTTDAQMFAAAKRVYDKIKKPGQPVFFMILTLEQHGPHDDKPLASLPAPFNQGLLPALPAKQELNLSTYLSRLQSSDEGMTQLENDFLKRSEPTVIVHFGDHLPSFSDAIVKMPQTLPAELQRYKNNLTYYMIKSNFDAPELPAYPMLDIAYLPSRVLRTAGLPEDSYFSALTTMETRCHGLYVDCPDKPMLESYYTWIFDRLHVYQ